MSTTTNAALLRRPKPRPLGLPGKAMKRQKLEGEERSGEAGADGGDDVSANMAARGAGRRTASGGARLLSFLTS